ncbi:MAG: MBL fold metallo-hydrolase [Desulfamplus sp.]|nr:MBL fold metallo-hydrolase [Desulfamplus sp.]MBF0257593.1 MBL fold metallo-hydrolase [Desulfamplus sp.]
MIIKTLEVGPIMANCYILGCEKTKEAVVIDPGDDADDILMALSKFGLKVKYLLNTHGHFDHVGANKRMKEVTKAQIMIHAEDEPMLSQLGRAAASFGLSAENSPGADSHLKDGDEISFGEITLKVIHTPGHSRGGICLYADGHVFVGDTLFSGSIGRTDLPGGDYNTLISSIREKIFHLPDNTIVYTGHGPETTIAKEKRTNPFLR